MKIPISWLKDFVEIDIPVEQLAERLTLAGLEVVKLQYVGVPQQEVEGVRVPPSDHLVWDRDKILLGAIKEVKPHPDADRLVLAMVDYGGDELEQCVTGAPNLFEYKGQGELNPPLWSPFAMEGSTVWDGHSDKPKLMTLKGKKLRGIYNKSMVCSEKELGISEEHEGIMILDAKDNFVPGTPLQDVLGDVVLDFDLTPNLARCFSVLGIAREIAALLNKELKEPSYDFLAEGAPIEGQVKIEIHEPELNPRFTLTLLKNTKVQESPAWMQHRLKLVGQRPINNVVDVTNYITFELGQPLHAYDYDKLVKRAGGKTPTIITRLPKKGEKLETLDDVDRELDNHNILVCDTAGVIGMGGIMGGADTEIADDSTNVLLEAANWNFINVRRSMKSQKIHTEAGTRFSRGVHPSQAILGVQRGIELMRQTGGGQIAEGVIDEYPNQPEPVTVELPLSEVHRLLGIEMSIQTVAEILSRLHFDVTLDGEGVRVVVPDHRMDISDDAVIGQADLIEEIARVYGYDKIPNTIMADEMPPQWANATFEAEEELRDLLVGLGLQETISYRFTTPEAEAMLTPQGLVSSLPKASYVEMANPSSADKTVLRHTLLISLLENAMNNQRFTPRQQIYEIGKVYFRRDDALPDEPRRLGILMTGAVDETDWLTAKTELVDFYDLKGVVDGVMAGLHLENVEYKRGSHSSFHPGRSADVHLNGKSVGTFGELHPLVAGTFKLTDAPILVAEFDLDALLKAMPERHDVASLPVTPAILEDIALIVREDMPASEVEAIIWKAGGRLLKAVNLFDVYRGDSIPTGKKSLAYSLTYQTDDKTLKDKDAAKVRNKIIGAAKHQLNAEVRSG